MSARLVSLLACIALVACERSQSPMYGLGRTATAMEIAAWDIDVNAAGVGLPQGSGTTQDGARYYGTLCAACHGIHGEGSATAPQLVQPDSGGAPQRRNIATHWPYAPPLLDYIRRAMPPDQRAPLGADTLYSLVAYLLDANHIALPMGRIDSAGLSRVVMPARARFVPDDRNGGPELR